MLKQRIEETEREKRDLMGVVSRLQEDAAQRDKEIQTLRTDLKQARQEHQGLERQVRELSFAETSTKVRLATLVDPEGHYTDTHVHSSSLSRSHNNSSWLSLKQSAVLRSSRHGLKSSRNTAVLSTPSSHNFKLHTTHSPRHMRLRKAL